MRDNPRRRTAILGWAAAFVLGATAASAGEFGISGDAGYFDFTNARKSAQAVFDGTAGGFTGGGSLRYTFGRGIFVAAGARYFQKTGERVFVENSSGEVFGLQHPLTVRTVPIYGLIGYRFERRRGLPLVPYIGLGGGVTMYHEEAEIGGLTEGVVDETKGAGYAVLGLEYGRGALRFGIEVMYSTVPNAAGVGGGGVADVYNEDDIGGFTAVGKLTFVP
jgi:hypothetical protein